LDLLSILIAFSIVCGATTNVEQIDQPTTTRYTSYKRELKDVDRCKCEGVEVGFVKISAREGTDEILGATIVGPTAGDMISAITLCSKWCN
jgi:pyruvate/2-oxoglutarate dehydrogenase complex dihydrolipoamide dehydrogenase (E3) component